MLKTVFVSQLKSSSSKLETSSDESSEELDDDSSVDEQSPVNESLSEDVSSVDT